LDVKDIIRNSKEESWYRRSLC